ncbi:tryptophan transporter [Petroclostridium sp. X23]|uniref:tryptophan transporter n=1 Tax=Petroclostridium sp. X23 TaxID=3045146 RepID=UPI0024AD5BF6|nr:tryptophan transporter [Petroclostridium sp. X23]WHH60330.1 hypothetical protein QKW49_06230 [Petroclostridium sp. X23]
MMETAVKREVKKRELKAVDVVLAGILIAAGAVLRLYTPPFFGITPNLVIGMYCLAILLIRPSFKEVIGIGIVAAAVCHFTTKSLIPYINFASEPIGAIVAGLLVMAPFKLSLGGKYSLKPFVVTFLGTAASGLTYITILKFLILFIETPKNPAFTYLLTVVVVTAVVNSVLAQVLYYPIKMALGKNDE